MLSRGKPKDCISLRLARSGSGDNKKEIRPARTKARGYHFVCAERDIIDAKHHIICGLPQLHLCEAQHRFVSAYMRNDVLTSLE